jgi:hypothetical protein
MVLVLEEKFLERNWWKYASGLAAVQILLWILLAKRYDPSTGILWMFRTGLFVWMTFAVAAFVPFVLGRLQLKHLFGWALAGYGLGAAAYFVLGLMPATRLVNLLPFAAFLQLFLVATGIGLVIEFGLYVYRKVLE